MLVTELKSLDNISKYNVGVLILPTKFSSYSDFVIKLEQLKQLEQLNLFNNKQIALKLDKIITEYELEQLELFIKQTINYSISYYIFTDMSVYYILRKYNLETKAVFFSKTINCSTYDIKEYNKLNIKCLVSTELQLEDLIKISNLENNFIYTYGYFNIFYSKRKLLSLYKQYSNLDYNPQNIKYNLLEETRKEYYPAIENNNGTFIYSSYCLLLFKELMQLNKNNYFYIDSNFIEEDKLLNIINVYNKLINNGYSEELLNEIKQIDENIGTSFMYLKPEILKEKNNG